jgi:hypothetical protein
MYFLQLSIEIRRIIWMQTLEQRVVEIEFDRFVDDGEVEDEIYEEYRVNTDYVHNLYGFCTTIGTPVGLETSKGSVASSGRDN